jgi:hypothetical protein
MSDPVIIALITACAAIPSTIGGIVAAYFAYKSAVASKATLKVSEHTEANTNHMKDELVALTAKSSHAAGVLEGKQDAASNGPAKTKE